MCLGYYISDPSQIFLLRATINNTLWRKKNYVIRLHLYKRHHFLVTECWMLYGGLMTHITYNFYHKLIRNIKNSGAIDGLRSLLSAMTVPWQRHGNWLSAPERQPPSNPQKMSENISIIFLINISCDVRDIICEGNVDDTDLNISLLTNLYFRVDVSCM